MGESGLLVFTSDAGAKVFVEALLERTKAFLMDEGNIAIEQTFMDLSESHSLVLKTLTSIINIEDSAKMVVALSFDRELIYKIFESYSAGIEIHEDEVPMYVEETAGDMINIVVGNVLAKFQQPGHAFVISTPLIVNEAKSISKYKNTRFYSAEIKTEAGSLSIYCITPGESYRKQFKQKGV